MTAMSTHYDEVGINLFGQLADFSCRLTQYGMDSAWRNVNYGTHFREADLGLFGHFLMQAFNIYTGDFNSVTNSNRFYHMHQAHLGVILLGKVSGLVQNQG